MRVTRTKLIVATSLSMVLGLTACSGRKSAFPLPQDGERWFCTPQGGDEWLCQESDNQFEQLAEKQSPRQVPSHPKGSGVDDSASLDAESELENTMLDERVESLKSDIEKVEPVAENILPAKVLSEQPAVDQSIIEQTTDSIEQNQPELEQKTASETLDTDDSELKQSDISPWVIQLAAYSQAASAESLAQQVEDSQRFNTKVKGKEYITVVIIGFDTRWQALERAEQLQQQHPQLSPWVRSGDDFERIIIR